MKEKNHIVKVTYTFTGHYIVRADSKAHAKEIVKQDTGLVMGGMIECNDDDAVKDWDFNIHPDVRIT